MALFQKFVFDDLSTIPIETLLQDERDAGIDNEVSVAEQLEAEREAVRVVARAEGFDAGLAFARSERAATVEGLIARLVKLVEDATADMEARIEAMADEASRLALDLAGALAGEALAAAPHAPLIAAIKAALSDAVQRPKIVIRLSPADIAEVEAAIAAESAGGGFDGRIVLSTDAALAPGDCEIDWQTGGIRLSQEARAAAIRELVNAFAAS